MAQCPECGHENPDNVQFCVHCHHTMFYQCPMCWHHQQTPLICEKCGLDMVMYWKKQLATARAVLVKEEPESMEKSANDAIGAINSVGFAFAHPVTFLGWVLAEYVLNKVRRP